MADWEKLCESMVETQIRSRGVLNEQVLSAMKSVPRHQFVPQELEHSAYDDTPLPIGYQQTISQPYIVAYMIEQANLPWNRSAKVLEIGTGCGYATAVLSHIPSNVFTIEIVESLAISARKRLESMGVENVHYKIGDGLKGWKEHAPFDAIIVWAAADTATKEVLIGQLKEGGRLIIPAGGASSQMLYKISKSEKGNLVSEELFPVRFVPCQEKKEE